MHGRKSDAKRFADIGVVLLLFAGLSLFQPFSPRRMARAADRRDPKRIEPKLVTAIRDGDLQAVRMLLDDGAGVNARDVEGDTPLILAAFYADAKCVELLLEKDANANATNSSGATPLIRAATNYEKSRLLVAAGADVRMRTTLTGTTPLILAARRAGNSRTVKLLLEHGASATEPDNAGNNPIMSGAASGDVEIVKLLLGAGAKANDHPTTKNPHSTDVTRGLHTPLMWAAIYNDVPMVRLLLDHGADPNQSTFLGNPLSQACWGNAFDAARVLIARGADVDAKDMIADFAPLHWAAGTEPPRAHLVKLLLASGADPNARGGETVSAYGMVPQTPLLIAQKRGRTPIVDALVAAGAKEQPYPEKIVTPRRELPEKLETSRLIDSAEKALAALQTSASRSFESFSHHLSTGKIGCVSCHQQYMTMAAVGHARNRSIRFDHEAAKEQIDLVAKNPPYKLERYIQNTIHTEPPISFGYRSFGLIAEGVPASDVSDGMVHHLLTIQSTDGHWINVGPRPPMAGDKITATALSIFAIKHYGWPGREDEFKASIERARRWLWNAHAGTNAETTLQLLGLHWAGESKERLTVLAHALRQQQRKDGGWAQLPTLESDAFATGEALYALAQTVLEDQDPMTDPAWQRGLRFLLETQEDDGTWHARRRAHPFLPTMASGFSHHRDSWISATATCWSVLALTQVLPIGSASGKPDTFRQADAAPARKHKQRIDFAQQIKPILERSCVGCHGGDKPRSLFRVDNREAILKGGVTGEVAMIPGHSEKSPLLEYVSGSMPGLEMPPKSQRKKFPALGTDEVGILRAWIDQGAEWPEGISLASPMLGK